MAESLSTWNFVLTGQTRAGTGALVAGINTRQEAVCHVNLIHADPVVRQEAHEEYFGKINLNDGWQQLAYSPWQYLNKLVFDNPQHDEISIGCHLPYADTQRLELYDLFAARAREGNFSIIQVVRSPIACLISLKQAQQTKVWCNQFEKHDGRIPYPIRLDAEEVITFCREHDAIEAKIKATCDDRLVIQYRDIVMDYQNVMAQVFDFIELPAQPKLVQPAYYRLRNKPILQRVSNWAEVKMDLPSELKRHIDSDDLF